MRIVIVGAGAVGTHLAKMLSEENENVVLLDESEEKLSKMESSGTIRVTGGTTMASHLNTKSLQLLSIRAACLLCFTASRKTKTGTMRC